MFKRSENTNYDPVTAPVPGVNQEARQKEINTLYTNAGDPITPSEPKITPKKSKILTALENLGIKIS